MFEWDADNAASNIREHGVSFEEAVMVCRDPFAMTEAQVEAAAMRDADAQPLTEAAMGRMRPVPSARTLRRALGLTQEDFAARFQIPLGTLRDWEQGRAEPDQPARSYLRVIAADPEAVRLALQQPVL